MKFGLFYQLPCAEGQSPRQRYQDTLDQIQLGDELGFDNAWLAEIHFDARFSVTPSPLMVAVAAAQRTKNIRLGVAVNLLPLHHPIRIAEDIATLDLLSDGRVEFGVGRGALPAHFQGFEVPLDDSRERFLEALQFVLTAWTEDEFSFEGKYHKVGPLRLVPKPLQKPHPPVHIASNSADTFELVGELGYSMLATPVIVPLPQLKEGVGRYKQALVDNGHAPNGTDISIAVPMFARGSLREAQTIPEPSVMNYLGSVVAMWSTPAMQALMEANPKMKEVPQRLGSITYDQWSNDVAIFGDPASCVEKIQMLQEELQLTECVCWFNQGGLISNSDVMGAMRLFAEKVMPHFR